MSKYFKLDKDKREIVLDKTKRYNVNIDILDLIIDLKQEIGRLNNIINNIENEVRNTTEEMYKTLVKIDGRGYYSANLTRLDYLLDKIKALKGVDKE